MLAPPFFPTHCSQQIWLSEDRRGVDSPRDGLIAPDGMRSSHSSERCSTVEADISHIGAVWQEAACLRHSNVFVVKGMGGPVGLVRRLPQRLPQRGKDCQALAPAARDHLSAKKV
ncbi:unnamed protein product, partial [Ectocarpus fasciculatus]